MYYFWLNQDGLWCKYTADDWESFHVLGSFLKGRIGHRAFTMRSVSKGKQASQGGGREGWNVGGIAWEEWRQYSGYLLTCCWICIISGIIKCDGIGIRGTPICIGGIMCGWKVWNCTAGNWMVLLDSALKASNCGGVPALQWRCWVLRKLEWRSISSLRRLQPA